MARPQEFRALPQAVTAAGCWRDWRREELTPHDGLVRADHPVLRSILERTQSASSLRRLLDRKSVVEGKSVSVRVALGGRRIIKKKKKHQQNYCTLALNTHNANYEPEIN